MAEKNEKRRGLGRGLSALMADVEPQTTETPEGGARRPERVVPVEKIVPNPDQPRRTFTDEQLRELADSIRSKGVIQPLIVRQSPKNPDLFEIVAGERRWRAAQLAQLHELPIIVREFNDTEVLEIAIIENIQRADLNPIEEAAGYRQLMFKFGHTQEKLAEALGKSRSHIANMMRLLNLPEGIRGHVSEGRLSAGHARALITAPNAEELAKQVVAKGLSVRETERLVKQAAPRDTPPKPTAARGATEKDADTKALEGDLSAALGMKVSIDHKADDESGQVTVSYKTLEQLDALCAILSQS
ncbi:ParB/RepB/Spo0J family partition protein [Allosediminivita pacifica]|uniref:ParB family chromosome partitioning protein n=1 Tax=Allosediminivita pacifica TaxID=1267769 RepID=A0A2T6B5Q4_9RHOB|nr:ParB/RepB/Spo0J family partition protein [Allosediminivita pacifica]PTX51409.1 ParB family chromosome partitioning protein [Allosediminivita pacifica]GGA99612.1 chromosome segregation DNA-binding protein [Allosediminivita pacifica]